MSGCESDADVVAVWSGGRRTWACRTRGGGRIKSDGCTVISGAEGNEMEEGARTYRMSGANLRRVVMMIFNVGWW